MDCLIIICDSDREVAGIAVWIHVGDGTEPCIEGGEEEENDEN